MTATIEFRSARSFSLLSIVALTSVRVSNPQATRTSSWKSQKLSYRNLPARARAHRPSECRCAPPPTLRRSRLRPGSPAAGNERMRQGDTATRRAARTVAVGCRHLASGTRAIGARQQSASCSTKSSPADTVYDGAGANDSEKMDRKASQLYLWMRFAALAVDGICALTIMAAVGVAADRATNDQTIITAAVLLTAVAVSLCEVVSDRSPGKWLMGLRIRRPDGSHSTIAARLARWAMKTSPLLLITASATWHALARHFSLRWDLLIQRRLDTAATTAAIGLFLLASGMFGRHRRALYDLLTGTAVRRVADDERPTGFEPHPMAASAVADASSADA